MTLTSSISKPAFSALLATWLLATWLLAAASAGEPQVYEGWPFDAAEAVRRQKETAEAIASPVALQTPLGKEGAVLRWRLIPAGKFMMGSPPTEPGHEGDERLHPETIAAPFYMLETQLTVGQYQALLQADPAEGAKEGDPAIPAGIPYRDTVDQVLPALAKRAPAGWKVILPDQVRLEYAARAGVATMNHGGDKPEDATPFAWTRENSDKKVHPVAQKKPNAWGLCDVIGNRWHWFWRDGAGYGDASTKEHIVYGGKYTAESGGNGSRLANIMISTQPEGARFALIRADAALPKGHPETKQVAQAETPPAAIAGQRIVSAGHSFHVFLPPILRELAQAAKIEGHTQVVLQSIGGSRVIQHWDLEKNQVKPALETGKVDVLTLSPIYLPDEGIENFAALGLKHNAKLRVTLQEFWLPYDVYALNYQKEKPPAVDRNARTAEELRKESAPYFASIDEHVRALNKKFGREAVFVVPAGQAAILLREKIIAGEAPGLKEQNDLFTDAIGHAKPPLAALNAYCHFAVIYRTSPVGLPVPSVLGGGKQDPPSEETVKLNRLLQELAWKAVTEHPLSGVK